MGSGVVGIFRVRAFPTVGDVHGELWAREPAVFDARHVHGRGPPKIVMPDPVRVAWDCQHLQEWLQ